MDEISIIKTAGESIGVIGGADGPTAILVGGDSLIWLVAALVIIVAASVATVVHIVKSNKK